MTRSPRAHQDAAFLTVLARIGVPLLAAACVTTALPPEGPRPKATTEENASKLEASSGTGRTRFDLPGECSSKLAVSHGIDDMAECEGLLGETQTVALTVTALAADPDAIDARIQVPGGPGALADGTLHATFTDGRPTSDGDLTFGRFSGDFGAGRQVFGFVLRERAGTQAAWIFHITGGSGCLSGARGELTLPEKTKGTLRLETAAMTACAAAAAPKDGAAVDPPPAVRDGGR